MNVSFTKKQEEYIAEQIKSGDFQNASEVVRDALRLHATLRERLLNDLKTEIQKGIDSEISKRSAQEILKAKRKEHGLL